MLPLVTRLAEARKFIFMLQVRSGKLSTKPTRAAVGCGALFATKLSWPRFEFAVSAQANKSTSDPSNNLCPSMKNDAE